MAERSTVKPITGFRTQAGDAQYDFEALANRPIPDTTLRVSGTYPDSKSVGDKISKIETQINGITINGKPLADGKITLSPSDIGAPATSHKHVSADIDGVVAIAQGGTGSNNGSTGLQNLLAAGPMVLKSGKQYGTKAQMDAFKDNGTAKTGQIFFVKV